MRSLSKSSEPEPSSPTRLVVCVGASMVQGQISSNFVDLLQQRMRPEGYQFINTGVAGYRAAHVLSHLDQVVARQPDYVVILVGTNDVTAALLPARSTKASSPAPSASSYQATMRQIVHRLREETGAKIALASLPMLGEDLGALACQRIREYNACLQELALQEQLYYLPVYERLEAKLKTIQQQVGRAFPGGALAFQALAQHFLLRQSLDAISRKNGFQLLTDGTHLNSCGAALVAEEIESFLRAAG